jgi:hypothetical protein
MRDRNRFFGNTLVVSVVSLFLSLAGIGSIVQAQDKEPMIIQATAMGTSTQMGKIVNVNFHIDQFSTQDDRKALIDAFKRSGQDGLVDALEQMKPKGRVRFASGGVGNDVKYIIGCLRTKDAATSGSSPTQPCLRGGLRINAF